LNNNTVTRFTSECDLCADLLTEYISAANEIVDNKEWLQARKKPSARQLASSLIDNAIKRREEAKSRLLRHKRQQH
jgi:hypothetical protein